jgi:4-hydroxymandelate oxidase
MDPINLHDYESAARERLPSGPFAYFAGGAGDEVTLRANRAAWDRVALRPRVLVDVAERSQRREVLGADLATPVLVAPMAFQRLAHADGELATARAVRAAGSAMILSTFATSLVEDVVAAAAPAHVWFQLYVFKDRGATKALVQRAAAAGCKALVVTVDAPLLGRRERPGGTHIELTGGVRAENLVGLGLVEPPGGGFSLPGHFLGQLDQSLDWDDVAWLRGLSALPVLVKGVLRGDDARRAVDVGCAGVIVSNHGGRQLDGAAATADALPEVVDAVGGRVPVLVDGGVRRGVDVVRALALGARAVLLGRPVLWGLAVDGERGATRVLQMLADEIDLAMALCGCRDLDEVTRDLLGDCPPFTRT